jgi:septum formation protein
MRLVLASASPRRLDLLRGIGLDPEPVPSGLEEGRLEGLDPEEEAVEWALRKGRAVAAGIDGEALVVAADTAVVLDGEPMGKPRDEEEAARMLRRLGGRVHAVVTGVALLRLPEREEATGAAVTRVRFATLTPEEIAWYVGTGEPMDKAGAYGIQGLGALLIERVEGDYANVVGLPLRLVRQLAGVLRVELRGGPTAR